MDQGDDRSGWERRQGAQRREDGRPIDLSDLFPDLAEQQAKQAEEKHLAAQQHAAEEKIATLGRRIRVLDGLLTDSLALLPLTLSQLKVTIQLPRFDPGALGTVRAGPNWADFAPIKPRGLRRIFGGEAEYERQMAQAQGSFEFAKVQHRRDEDQRQRALAVASARYEREVADAQAEVAEQNAYIDACQAALEMGDRETVEWFVGLVLDNSWYPEGFPRRHRLAYRPEKRDLTVDFELPPQEVIPKERGYRYVKESDVIEALPRPQNEVQQHYAHIIACIALRTLNEIFKATPAEVVTAVLFNGRVSGIDRATGKRARPHLISVPAQRLAVMDLELAEVEPMVCLKRYLHARVSPSPFDMEPIKPFEDRS